MKKDEIYYKSFVDADMVKCQYKRKLHFYLVKYKKLAPVFLLMVMFLFLTSIFSDGKFENEFRFFKLIVKKSLEY